MEKYNLGWSPKFLLITVQQLPCQAKNGQISYFVNDLSYRPI